jgi:hypothetical protein
MNSRYGGRIASADDYYYAWKKGWNLMTPTGVWLGPRVGNDLALYNDLSGNYSNPDAGGSVFVNRYFRCATNANWY